MGPVHAAAGRLAASALFAQITAAGAALEKLDAQLDAMAERADIVTPDFDGTGETRRVADARAALGAAGQDTYGAVTGRDIQAVSLLAAARQLVALPVGVHETVAAVARLLGQGAKLLTYDHVGRYLVPRTADRRSRGGARCDQTVRRPPPPGRSDPPGRRDPLLTPPHPAGPPKPFGRALWRGFPLGR